MQTTTPHSKNRVIVIDDNPAIHDDFRKILAVDRTDRKLDAAAAAMFGIDKSDSPPTHRPKMELEFAHQGKEGYDKVCTAVKEKRPYTLAFCDMRMPPGWDGLTTIEKLWEADEKLQVVICSAYSDNTWADVSKRLGYSDRLLILKKPFDNAEVLQIAVALVEKRRLAEAAEIKRDELHRLVAERTLRLSEARRESERFLNAIDSMLIGVDASGIIQKWNFSATKIFGIPEERALGKYIEDLPINWEDSGINDKMLGRTDDDLSKRYEASFVNAEGSQRIVGFSSYPVRDDDKHDGTLVLGSDLTDHHIMAQQLQQAQKLESVGQLAAGVAHEINTPMQYVGDNLDYLKTKFEKLMEFVKKSTELMDSVSDLESQNELVGELQEMCQCLRLDKLFKQIPEALHDSIVGVSNVSRIVRAMKELSHPGGDEKTLVDVNQILETTLTVSANEWKYVADVQSNLDQKLGLVAGFPGELSQVFLNLIVNSAHAISDKTDGGNDGKGNIVLETKRLENIVRIVISDTGGGIPRKYRDQVFNPFFTTKEVGKGTGQGLAIAHSVISQKHDGKIWFHVDEGVGTTFYIDLPAAQNLDKDQPFDSQDLTQAITKGKK